LKQENSTQFLKLQSQPQLHIQDRQRLDFEVEIEMSFKNPYSNDIALKGASQRHRRPAPTLKV